MGLIEIDVRNGAEEVLMLRPRLLVEAARHGARLHLERGATTPGPAGRARLTADEQAQEMLRRRGSPAYRPARHIEALARLFAANARERA